MNALQTILEEFEEETIWFWISESTKDRFKQELEELQMKWKDGSLFVQSDHISNCMAIHQSHTVAFISEIAWSFSFAKPYKDTIIKIDYQKWIQKDDSYRIWNH